MRKRYLVEGGRRDPNNVTVLRDVQARRTRTGMRSAYRYRARLS